MYRFIGFLFLIFFALSSSAAEDSAISFYIENDTNTVGGPGTDQSYSSGFKLSYIWAKDKDPELLKRIFLNNQFLIKQYQETQSNFGMALTHKIYTPDDTIRAELIKDDRPYAAWLGLEFSVAFSTEQDSDTFELGLGMIGPEALGQQVQNNFHDWIRFRRSNGWENQLAFEPTVQLTYQHRFRVYELAYSPGDRYFDVIPYWEVGFGNVLVNLAAGGVVRLGTLLPKDFGPSRPSANNGGTFVDPHSTVETKMSDNKVQAYLFAGMKAGVIGRDIFLDGNTFQDSHRVTKYPFNAESEVGFGAKIYDFSLIWRFVTRSPQFKENSKFNSFASVTLQYVY